MELDWQNKFDSESALLVPTRSLASALQAEYTEYQLGQGREVWEAPTIIVWSDYCQLIWELNRASLAPKATLINSQQSLILWAQVVELSRRQERELTLLNVKQTSRAAQRSWRLINDWCLSVDQLKDDHDADLEKLIEWIDIYQNMLGKRQLIDQPTLLSRILQVKQIKSPFKKVHWYAFDLISDAQRKLITLEEKNGISHCEGDAVNMEVDDQFEDQISFEQFADSDAEIYAALWEARKHLENKPDARISVVVPDLHQKYSKVQEAARDVFYPNKSPMEVHLSDTVYRFSLGQPLANWPAIESALAAIRAMRNSLSVSEFCLMLRNQYFTKVTRHQRQARKFERWLKKQRLNRIILSDVPHLIEQCFELEESQRDADNTGVAFHKTFVQVVKVRNEVLDTLDQRRQNTQYASLPLAAWLEVFENWLQAWGWRISISEGTMNTKDYQLQERWLGFLKDFSNLAVVQSSLGLTKVTDLLFLAANDAIFLPKAAHSPILISGVYEAIGQKSDLLRLVGMSQNFPPSATRDAFIPNRALMESGYHDANPNRAFRQAKKVITSLLKTTQMAVISYPLTEEANVDVPLNPSSLFREKPFVAPQTKNLRLNVSSRSDMELYQDMEGPAWSGPKLVAGGTSVFEHQSNCAFKAFVTHQLRFNSELESDFGLDSLDRGIIIHRLLEIAWGELQTSDQLEVVLGSNFSEFLDDVTELLFEESQTKVYGDKFVLLKLEKNRLKKILSEWLNYELKRPANFVVLEREQQYQTEIGGIEFSFVIDRLDATEDGRTIVIDYKTGATARKDWLAERMAKPQLPIYAVALNKLKAKPISGFSYAKVDAKKMEFQELAETDILKPESNYNARRYANQWAEARIGWQTKIEQLAKEFRRGDARVNPIEDKTCAYCDLASVCRVSQLRHQTNNNTDQNLESGDRAGESS